MMKRSEAVFYILAFALSCVYLIVSFSEEPGLGALLSFSLFTGLMVICAAVASEAARYSS